jgi:hypothetical protein
MAVTIEILKEKIARIQQELADVSAGLDEITKAAAPPAARSHPRANRPCVDKEPLRQTFTAMFKRMGIEHVQPIGTEKLQELMRQDGIKPEDNIFSRGIIEMREE